MKFIKSKKVWYIVLAIILMGAFYGIGLNGAKAEVNGAKLKHEDIVKEIDTASSELDEIQDQIKEAQGELDDKKDEFDEAQNVLDQKKDTQDELSSIESDLKDKKKEVKDLKSDIKEKSKELEKITSGIIEKEEEPIVLGAGQYIVGSDVPEGRYKAVPVGRGSNFFVRGAGSVNTILGDSGQADYTFFTVDGDEIDTRAEVKLIPVE